MLAFDVDATKCSVRMFWHVNHIQTMILSYWIHKLNLKLNILIHDRIRDYFRLADLGFFLRRVRDIWKHVCPKNARRSRKLIPNNPEYLSAQYSCQKNCTVVGLRMHFVILYDYFRKNPPCNEWVKCRESWALRLHLTHLKPLDDT